MNTIEDNLKDDFDSFCVKYNLTNAVLLFKTNAFHALINDKVTVTEAYEAVSAMEQQIRITLFTSIAALSKQLDSTYKAIENE